MKRSFSLGRLFVFNKKTNCHFLVDIGLEVTCCHKIKKILKLQAANGPEIKIFGSLTTEVPLGLLRLLMFTFIVTDVKHAIIGADFLTLMTHYQTYATTN